MNQDSEHFDPKKLKRMLLKRTVLLDWDLIEREISRHYRKAKWKKLKRPVVLPTQLVEGQERIYVLKKKHERAWQRAADITAEISAIELALRNYVWYAIDSERAERRLQKSRTDAMPTEQMTLEHLIRLAEPLPPPVNIPFVIAWEANGVPPPPAPDRPTRRPAPPPAGI